MAAGRRIEIAQDRLANLPAEFMAADNGTAEVNSAPYARIVDLFGNPGEAFERTGHAKRRWIGDAHVHAVCLELAAQHSLGRPGETRMSRRILRMRGRAE